MSPVEALFGLLIGVVILMAVLLLAICRSGPRRHADASPASSDAYVSGSSDSVHSGHSDHGCVSHDGFSDSCASDGGGHF